jgi:hypothetical protein
MCGIPYGFPESHDDIVAAKTFHTLASVFGVVGGAVIGAPIGYSLSSGQPPRRHSLDLTDLETVDSVAGQRFIRRRFDDRTNPLDRFDQHFSDGLKVLS